MESKSSPSSVKDEPMEDETAIPNGVSPAANPDANGGDADMADTEDVKKDVKLEDLFADVDSDDEFPSSAPAPTAQPGSSSPPAAVSNA